MPLDQVKTQVLLLHSEQSTLDSLSAGFNDRYTVHCATSGTEALNTLGETPIHVIVSAQDLPGMSGVEALREAKRRSPDTIGILLAGKNEQGLEALVGAKEIYQVVRGGISAEDLSRLVDDATQQMRLMALAESANDTILDSTSEHIVMETSENGATIISDGTGQVPALDPKKVSASVSVGAQSVDVLVLTKDEEFLATVKESSRGLHNVIYANTLKQAENAVKKKKVGVAVVDAGMVGENVEKLTQHLRGLQPRLVAIVAGRRDDGEMLMDLINRGKVYRFLLKPVSPGRARLAVEASVKHHLEAPDAAFKTIGKTTAKSQPAAEPKASKPADKQAAAKDTPNKVEPEIKVAPQADAAPIGDGLSDAFDGDDSRFTETMTGIVTSVGKSISGIKDKVQRSDSTPAPDSDGTDGSSPFADPKILGAGVVGLIAVIALGFFMFGGSGDPVDTERAAPTAAETPAETPASEPEAPPPATDIEGLLEEARLARNAGQIFNPPGSNAIELYLAAAAEAPGDLTVQDELAATIEDALAMAESALLERRVAEAAAALSRISLAEPDNARLPFLTAQVQDLQLRAYIDEARIAIRDARFDDAAQSIALARSLDAADADELTALEIELESARSEQQVDDVLLRANQRLASGDLIAPPNDNARYYYEVVLSNDPENAAARQGLVAIAGKLTLQARAEIDAGNFATAEAILADARSVDPSSAEVAASTQALADARQRVVDERAQAEAVRQAAAERDAANRRAAEQAAEAARLKAEREAEAERLAAAETSAPATAAATSAEPVRQTPVPVSSLTRKRYVAPSYPRSAERRNLSGWVAVVFTVYKDGSVGDIRVVGSEPDDVFVNSATKAVEKWEFEPVIENGVAVEKLVGVRLAFVND